MALKTVIFILLTFILRQIVGSQMPLNVDVFGVGPSAVESFIEIGLIVITTDYIGSRRRSARHLLDRNTEVPLPGDRATPNRVR